MISKNFKIYIVEDKEMEFNQKLFKELFMDHVRKEKQKIGIYEEILAEKLFLDRSSIHNWRMNLNGPGDIEKIQMLADFWNIDYKILLKKKTEIQTMKEDNKGMKAKVQNTEIKKLDKGAKKSLRNYNQKLLMFLREFKNTTGFLWNDDGSEYDMNFAYVLYNSLQNCLEEEYIDLATNLYDPLEEYMERLLITFEGDFDTEEGDTIETIDACVKDLAINLYTEFKNLVYPYL